MLAACLSLALEQAQQCCRVPTEVQPTRFSSHKLLAPSRRQSPTTRPGCLRCSRATPPPQPRENKPRALCADARTATAPLPPAAAAPAAAAAAAAAAQRPRCCTDARATNEPTEAPTEAPAAAAAAAELGRTCPTTPRRHRAQSRNRRKGGRSIASLTVTCQIRLVTPLHASLQ